VSGSFPALALLVPRLASALVTLLFGWLILRLALPAVREGLAKSGVAQAAPAIVNAVTIAGWILVLAATFEALGLSGLALMLAGLTLLVALIAAWTASGAAADVVAGLLLAQARDFAVGARVRAGVPGHEVEGEILALELRKVRLRDAEGRVHVLPNRTVESHPWVVL
jgi:small-conductance mechanosensitive channel